MDDIDMIDGQEGSGESVEIGYLNPNGQQCFGHCGVTRLTSFWELLILAVLPIF